MNPGRPKRLVRLVDSHLTESLAQGKAQGTIAYRRLYLLRLVKWLETRGISQVRHVRYRTLSDYLVDLRKRGTRYHRTRRTDRSNRTLASEVSVLRSFFAWLTERRILLFNPAENLEFKVRASILPKNIPTIEEISRLLKAPEADTLGLRDRAILETLYSTGVRRAELCGIDVYDLDAASGTLFVRAGKGTKDRVVPIGRRALDAVNRYLRSSRPMMLTNPKESALFLASETGQRLRPKTLNYLVRKHARTADIETPLSPHTLRHACATHLLRNGADIRHVQLILGHSSVATTQVYTHVAVRDLAVTHRRHHPRTRFPRT